MTGGKILVIDDDPQIRRVMLNTLCRCGYEVLDSRDGPDGIDQCQRQRPGVILLDLSLPGMDGLQVCKSIREFCNAPIIILSGRSQKTDKIQALDAGADDYLTKPFDMEELLAHVRAAVRRISSPPGNQSTILKELKIDFERRLVLSSKGNLRLTPKEVELLQILLDHAGQTVSHRKLLQTIWGPDFGSETGYLRVFVNHIRQKIEPKPAKPQYLLTEPWVGYRLALPTGSLEKPGVAQSNTARGGRYGKQAAC